MSNAFPKPVTHRQQAQVESSVPWIADRGDGTYKNPVLYADYSDPDVVRVGDDYWMIASSFCHVPGLPILHSRDLVNWSLVNHALERLVPEKHFASTRHGGGVWAPAIRFHAGQFWIFYPDPDFGIYVVTATDPREQWSKPRMIKAGSGLIDPCPFWDDDGRAWMVHGWAKSRSGFCNRITLNEISPDGTHVLSEGCTIIDGEALAGWHTVEGPKLYKRNGYYYIFTPAGGVSEGYQAVFRSRKLSGPFEQRIVLEQGTTSVNGPHQGAWVNTPKGEHWFLHFQEMPAYGRVVHLQPMDWGGDDWPVMGSDRDRDGTGEPVLLYSKPALDRQVVCVPATSDAFIAGRPGRQWQWQGNPQDDWLLPVEKGDSVLRLASAPLAGHQNLWHAAHLLLQKFSGPAFRAEVTLDLASTSDGQRAGLVVFGYDYAWVGLRRIGPGRIELQQAICKASHEGGKESTAASKSWPAENSVTLAVDVGADLRCFFSWRASEKDNFSPIGDPFTACSSKWVGAKLGLFCSGLPGGKGGHANFREFVVSAE